MSATGTGWLVAGLLLLAVLLARPTPGGRRPPASAPVRVRELLRRRPPRSRPEDELLAGARTAERAAALLRAGITPATAWRHATSAPGATGPGAFERGDADVGGVDLTATPPAVQAVWRLAERTGAPATDALAACAAGLRADADAHAALRVATAGARVSARTVALLPLVGLALGAALGAPPWQTLLATVPGRGCALLGTLLLLAGRSWTRRMVRTAAGGLE